MRLDNRERAFLKKLEQLEIRKDEVHWPTLARELKLLMFQAWNVREGLERKGFISLEKQLRYIEVPTVTNAGLKALKKSAPRRAKKLRKAA